jgi:hypothetical protein
VPVATAEEEAVLDTAKDNMRMFTLTQNGLPAKKTNILKDAAANAWNQANMEHNQCKSFQSMFLSKLTEFIALPLEKKKRLQLINAAQSLRSKFKKEAVMLVNAILTPKPADSTLTDAEHAQQEIASIRHADGFMHVIDPATVHFFYSILCRPLLMFII